MQVDNKEKQKALDLAEASRETEWKLPSFIAELFRGQFRWDLLHPFPLQDENDKKVGDDLIEKTRAILEKNIDPDQIDRDGVLSPETLKALADGGLFGLKIPTEYGGIGLSQTNYSRLVAYVASYCQSTATWLSAHQSIGVPQPLKLCGTKEQKEKWLPRLAAGAVSAFALTEPGVGSDPAKMKTVATPSDDGSHYLINGEKLWITNGPDAEILVVMAQTPPKVVNGKETPQITAFVVDLKDPESAKGFAVAHRCNFMGLTGISNGVLRFTDLKVPADNIIGKTGQGLKIALMTLNTGRLTVPTSCGAAAKLALHYARKWCNERIQWGVPIGKHQAVRLLTARMAAETFAMESMSWLACAMADRGNTDIRLEAAMAKYFASEALWRVLDDFIQVRGGRGYESVSSLKERGEAGIPCERLMRDARVLRILEGTSQIMQLVIAREALDTHFRLLMPLVDPKTKGKVGLFFKAVAFYAAWYPKQWLPAGLSSNVQHLNAKNRAHLAYAARTSKRLARRLFHCMGRHQQALERRQLLLARFVDIGTDLYAMAASLARAEAFLAKDPGNQSIQQVTDLFCRIAEDRIEQNFRGITKNNDDAVDAVSETFNTGGFSWMEDDILIED